VAVVIESLDPARRRIALALAPSGEEDEGVAPSSEPAPKLGTLGDLLRQAADKKGKKKRP
jgi:hypothetical protein